MYQLFIEANVCVSRGKMLYSKVKKYMKSFLPTAIIDYTVKISAGNFPLTPMYTLYSYTFLLIIKHT